MEANTITGTQRPEEIPLPSSSPSLIDWGGSGSTTQNQFSKDNIKERKQSV